MAVHASDLYFFTVYIEYFSDDFYLLYGNVLVNNLAAAVNKKLIELRRLVVPKHRVLYFNDCFIFYILALCYYIVIGSKQRILSFCLSHKIKFKAKFCFTKVVRHTLLYIYITYMIFISCQKIYFPEYTRKPEHILILEIALCIPFHYQNGNNVSACLYGA